MRYSILVPVLVTTSLIAAPLAIGGTSAAASTLPAYGVTWTADSAANTLKEFAPGASGAATPIATVAGPDTGLDDPTGVALGPAGAVFVSNSGNNSITEYASDASGDATPTATITGAKTGLDEPQGVTVSNGSVWVTDPPSNLVEGFSTGSTGDELPAQTIAGPKTDLDHPSAITLDAGLGGIIVANTPSSGPARITGYFKGRYGNVSPDVNATGTAKHPITSPTALYTDALGETWIADSATNALTEEFVFPGLSTGLFPIHTITGAATELDSPSGIAIDAAGDVVVANAGDQSVLVFAANAKADAAPIRTITGAGAATGAPNGDAVFGTAPSGPTNLQVQIHKTTAHLTWDPPAQTGGGIIGYEVEMGTFQRFPGGGSESSGGASGHETTTTSYTKKNLKPGRSYIFQVIAVNAFGDGVGRPVIKTLVAPPSQPRHVSATSGHHSIAVHWTKPANDGGLKITKYDVEYATCSFAAAHCSFASRPASASSSYLTIHGLSAGTSYHVRVVARNKSKIGVPSRAVTATPLA